MKGYAGIILQIAFWSGIWALLIFSGDTDRQPPNFVELTTMRILFDIIVFNSVYYLLLPIYFTKGHRKLFFILFVSGFVSFVALKMYTEGKVYPRLLPEYGASCKKRNKAPNIVFPIFMGLMLFGMAAALRGFSAYEQKKNSEEEANRRRLEAELALLKSQINPHFLVNTLNNLYGISLTEPEKTPDAILKLSEMVGYILYECQKPVVSLTDDLAFIENYIALQRLRLPPNVTLNVSLPTAAHGLHIEPMILIPFIENAFKHGLTTKQPCRIEVSLRLESGTLHMHVLNTDFTDDGSTNSNAGIGLANTLQRLQHSYPERHHLVTDTTDGLHQVRLTIQLHA